MVITSKTKNIQSLFPLKYKNDLKTIINHMLSTKEFILMVHVSLGKPNVMQKLDEINIIIQLKVQNHKNTFDVTSTTVLCGLSFQMLQQMLRPGRT